MNYKALARIWRPSNFDQIVGQENVCTSLKNALKTNRIHHAWLFSGTRGVGKTTIARILAKALNCEAETQAPCLQCENCRAFAEGNFIDVIEIDAASRTKVEDTRELLENVQYLPSKGRYKIYIIDEVHMLSTHSFNALLKTLEEPPEHVKFILATTNPDKLPITILSRCLRFHLRNLFPDEIAKQMAFILTEEKVSFEPEALDTIAKKAEGSMRDALSLLDGAIALGNGTVSQSMVAEMVGLTDASRLFELVLAVFKKDYKQSLAHCREIQAQGGRLAHLLDEMISLFHQISLFKLCGASGATTVDSEHLTMLSDKVSAEDLQLFYEIALKAKDELGLVSQESIAFEMMLLRMLFFSLNDCEAENDYSNTGQKRLGCVKTSESLPSTPSVSLEKSKTTLTNDTQKTKTQVEVRALKEQESELKVNASFSASLTKDSWPSFVKSLGLTGLAQTILNHSELITFEDGVLHLLLEEGHRSMVTDITTDRIISALERSLQCKIKLKIDYSQETLCSPSRLKEKRAKEELTQTTDELLADETLNQLVEQCQGEILTETINSEKNS